ncbi:hypothetical protein GQ44DRAFT_764685 [Phaeosphaeriaceae sp. PMI808]|nr:hypothetical protein GQ44DRAFT_764685 [Phaeosphaeriaceae sp. PMI808]
MSSPYGGEARVAAPIIKQPVFTAVIWTGTCIASVALAFRFYVRFRTFRRLLADDFLAGFAWIILLATAILWQVITPDLYELMEVTAAMRLPSENFVENAERYMKGSLAVLFLFYVGLWSIKMSFLVFFYRLGDQVTYYRVSWWIVTIFTVSAGFVCLGDIQYHCLADPLMKVVTKCLSRDAIMFQNVTLKVNCTLDVFTDALIMMLPISILWNVRISMSRRIALGGIFSLVIITMAIAIVRVTVTTEGKNTSKDNKQVESTWLYTWHFVESCVAIIVACVASFRALFTNKERAREAFEALERERESSGRAGLNLRVIKARAKHFQDSLFDTVKSSNDAMATSITEHALRTNSYESHAVSKSGSSHTDEMPALNMHGMVTETEAEKARV